MRLRVPAPVGILLLLTIVVRAENALGRLPVPDGRFGIGRVTLALEEGSRLEPLGSPTASRWILVDVWYPADRSTHGQPAQYLDIEAFERALTPEGLRKQMGRAYEAARSEVDSHAVSQAPFARSLRTIPVLLFSPGGGMIRELYAAQLGNLASHGYAVAAMTHSYDGFGAVFPNREVIVRDTKRWPSIPSVEGVANLNQLEWHTQDMLFVLDELSRFAGTPFSGHLDLSRVGAFGHSFGGVVAAHACQKDVRIKACLNQDGAMAMKPFYPDVHGWGMDQPFLFLERPPNRKPLTDADLQELKLTRAQATDLVERLNESREALLRSTGGGSYRVLLRRDATTHMDFSDLPILSAKDTGELDRSSRAMATIRRYTLAFFDKHLQGRKGTPLDHGPDDTNIDAIERYAPAVRARHSRQAK